ncbi:PfaD family polyunsaturated fatty acid/polyketide biosynthesis protein, partial [bacterium]|nr:PfaD family polyunsaturated fatty acid/polyketide biosynthesis protein [bacterium]
MSSSKNNLRFSGVPYSDGLVWEGPEKSIAFKENEIISKLLEFKKPAYVVQVGDNIGLSNEGKLTDSKNNNKASSNAICHVPPLPPENLGDQEFKRDHKTKYAFYAGSMAHGISSEKMVIALGKEGFLASYGAGGILPNRLEDVIQTVQRELPKGPYAFNLIHNPFQEAMERNAADLYLKHGVTTIEASAFMELTPHVVRYRVAGLSLDANDNIQIKNRIIAKISRREVAQKFMEPPQEKFLIQLLEQGLISELQVKLAKEIPMADDVTVEADSGGHTDNRPLVSILPSIIALRNEIQEKYKYKQQIRVGAAGGVGTPESALAAFMMGAAYIVTGSVNQACLEAGSSDHVKNLLAQVEMADVAMAPAMDMFEMGGKLQVIKRGTLFAMKAQKLADLYRTYNSIDEIPAAEKE